MGAHGSYMKILGLYSEGEVGSDFRDKPATTFWIGYPASSVGMELREMIYEAERTLMFYDILEFSHGRVLENEGKVLK